MQTRICEFTKKCVAKDFHFLRTHLLDFQRYVLIDYFQNEFSINLNIRNQSDCGEMVFDIISSLITNDCLVKSNFGNLLSCKENEIIRIELSNFVAYINQDCYSGIGLEDF
jgi:hypothetical protein